MSDVQRLEVLDRIDCLLLLRSQSLGRVVFTAHAFPACQPVAFLLDGERVLFRAVDGSTLSDAAGSGNIVAVHVDNAHQGQTSFWSVTVVGCCQIITDAAVSPRSPRCRSWPTHQTGTTSSSPWTWRSSEAGDSWTAAGSRWRAVMADSIESYDAEPARSAVDHHDPSGPG